MEIILFLVTAVIIMVAVFAGLSARSPLFVFVVIAAMLGGLASPLWFWLYGVAYDAGLYFIAGTSVPLVALLGGWILVFPTLLVFATMRRAFTQIGYIGSWGLTGALFLYFWAVESIGLSWKLWSYDNEITALGLPTSAFLALLHTLCAMILLRVIYEYWRVSLPATLPIIPIVFGLQAFCYGLIGSPYYVMSMLTGTSILTAFGLLCTIAVVGWGLHSAIIALLSIQANTGATAGLSLAEIAVIEELARQKDE